MSSLFLRRISVVHVNLSHLIHNAADTAGWCLHQILRQECLHNGNWQTLQIRAFHTLSCGQVNQQSILHFADYDFIIQIYRTSFISILCRYIANCVDASLCCFQFEIFVNNMAVNVLVQVFLWPYFSFILDKQLRVKLHIFLSVV